MFGMKRIGLLMAAGLASVASFMGLSPETRPKGAPEHRFAGGKIHVSRSRWIPGGPRRNCGKRGISPKSVARHAAAG